MQLAANERVAVRYEVVDSRTGSVVKIYKPEQRRAAYRMVDKRDAAYGAVRYGVRIIWSEFGAVLPDVAPIAFPG